MSMLTIAGRAFLPGLQVAEVTLAIEDGRIAAITPGIDAGADVVARGFVAPGLIDLQVNGAYGCDFTVAPESIPQVAARLPAAGVTTFVPTIITSQFDSYPARLAAARAAIDALPAGAARVPGLHLEGPYMNPARRGAHDPAFIRQIDPEEVLRWAEPDVVRIVTLAPELPGALEAAAGLAANGIVVSAGHSDATYEQAQAGFAAGMSWGTHLFNAMSELKHREPGLPGALLAGTVPCGLIVDGAHVHPAAVRLAYRALGHERVTLVTDAMAAAGMPGGTYALAGNTVIVDDVTARLPNGTLAGSILSLDQAVRNMVAFSGCTPAEAIAMATETPARVLGLADRGRLAAGLRADLVLLDDALNVTAAMVAGTFCSTAQ